MRCVLCFMLYCYVSRWLCTRITGLWIWASLWIRVWSDWCSGRTPALMWSTASWVRKWAFSIITASLIRLHTRTWNRSVHKHTGCVLNATAAYCNDSLETVVSQSHYACLIQPAMSKYIYCIYTATQKFGLSKISNVFKEVSSLKYRKKIFCEILLQFKITVFYFNIL